MKYENRTIDFRSIWRLSIKRKMSNRSKTAIILFDNYLIEQDLSNYVNAISIDFFSRAIVTHSFA